MASWHFNLLHKVTLRCRGGLTILFGRLPLGGVDIALGPSAFPRVYLEYSCVHQVVPVGCRSIPNKTCTGAFTWLLAE